MAARPDKQTVVNEIADLLGIPRDELGNGSKEHLRLLQNIAMALGLSPVGGKHQVARRIVEHLGGEWTRDCYSTGDSVQTHAFRVMLGPIRDRLGPRRVKFILDLAAARATYRRGDPPPAGNACPERCDGPDSDFVRCPQVVAWVLAQAEGICECCGEPAPFDRADGSPYLEVHHVTPLAEGGPDTVDNAVALCPTCHRAAHHAMDRRDRRRRLMDRLVLRSPARSPAQ